MKAIHMNDAIRLLEDGQKHELKVWSLIHGDIIHYRGAVCIGSYRRGSNHRILLTASRQVREFRDCTLFWIDGLEVYL